jgi:hypothetical protein
VHDEHFLFAIAEEEALVEAVRARYADGPFVTPAAGVMPVRRVEIMGNIVRESGALRDEGHLAHFLADRLREPVVLQWPGLEYGCAIFPDQELDTERRAIVMPEWNPTVTFELAIDGARQRAMYRGFEDEIPTRLAALFPIQNRRKTARLDLTKARIYDVPNQNYVPGAFDYNRLLHLELQLARFEWSADGNERTLVDLGKELVIRTYEKLTPDGRFIRRGKEYAQPADEFAAGFDRDMRRLARRIRGQLDELASWHGVTPRMLVEG